MLSTCFVVGMFTAGGSKTSSISDPVHVFVGKTLEIIGALAVKLLCSRDCPSCGGQEDAHAVIAKGDQPCGTQI